MVCNTYDVYVTMSQMTMQGAVQSVPVTSLLAFGENLIATSRLAFFSLIKEKLISINLRAA